MFSKGKSALKLLENNAILSHFDVGRLYASGGPESVWKIYEGVGKADGKVRFLKYRLDFIRASFLILLLMISITAVIFHCVFLKVIANSKDLFYFLPLKLIRHLNVSNSYNMYVVK